jgi:hypothetical protein
MKKIIMLTLLVLFFTVGTEAQRISKIETKSESSSYLKYKKSSELKPDRKGLFGPRVPGVFSISGSGFGLAYLFGDVGGSIKEQALFGLNDWKLFNTSFLYSLGAHHLFPNNFGVKAAIHYGRFSGDDIGSRNLKRGYDFKSNILEFTLHGEYVFWGGPNSMHHYRGAWYGFAGAGIMNSNAELKFNGVLVSESPAGRKDDIKLVSIAPVIPFGIGYNYRFSDKLTLGAEFGWQVIMSDYADGISAQNSKSNDALSSLTMTLPIKLEEQLVC